MRRIRDIDAETAQLAIDSCRNNEVTLLPWTQPQLLAIKRLMDDKKYKGQVIQMAHGEIEMDMDSILVFSLSLSHSQYRDKIQELREALQDDDDDMESDGEDWNQNGEAGPSDLQGDDSDNACSLSQKRSHEEGKSDRKLPRLTLDDALIMVGKASG